MRICFLGHYTGGGTESATVALANELSKDYKVYLLNTCLCEPSFAMNKDIRFEYLREKSVTDGIFKLISFIRKKRIDVLISVEAMMGIYSIPATVLGRCKHIVWEHANYYQNQGSSHIQKIREIELRTANAYVVLTKRDMRNFKTHFKKIRHIEYIYNIAEPQGTAEYDINSKVIMSAGHIRKIKNFIAIPEIGKIIFKKHPDWKWIIYGEATGDEYKKVEKKVKEYGLGKSIIFYGRCREMQKAYQNAAMYVMTSFQEGLPMVLLEAKSNKLPLVSFDIETGPDEIIRDGVNGFLIEPYNIFEMAAKINMLIENKEVRKRFSNNSSLDFEQFSRERISVKWNKLLRIVDSE